MPEIEAIKAATAVEEIHRSAEIEVVNESPNEVQEELIRRSSKETQLLQARADVIQMRRT